MNTVQNFLRKYVRLTPENEQSILGWLVDVYQHRGDTRKLTIRGDYGTGKTRLARVISTLVPEAVVFEPGLFAPEVEEHLKNIAPVQIFVRYLNEPYSGLLIELGPIGEVYSNVILRLDAQQAMWDLLKSSQDAHAEIVKILNGGYSSDGK